MLSQGLGRQVWGPVGLATEPTAAFGQVHLQAVQWTGEVNMWSASHLVGGVTSKVHRSAGKDGHQGSDSTKEEEAAACSSVQLYKD